MPSKVETMYPGETQFSHVAFVFVSQKRLQVSLVFAPHFHPCRRRLWHCWRCPALACYRISSWRPAETKAEITFERKGLATRLHRLYLHISNHAGPVYDTADIARRWPTTEILVGGHRHRKCKYILNGISLLLNSNGYPHIFEYAGLVH